MSRHALVAALVVAAASALGAVLAVPAHAGRTQMLAQGPVKVPPGGSFLSVGYLPQPPGASFGPHGHVPGFVYALSGEVTVADKGSTIALNGGEGHFIPALAVHTHKNADDRLPAGALAIGLVVAVIILVVVAALPRSRLALVPVLLVAIIAGGALALSNP